MITFAAIVLALLGAFLVFVSGYALSREKDDTVCIVAGISGISLHFLALSLISN